MASLVTSSVYAGSRHSSGWAPHICAYVEHNSPGVSPRKIGWACAARSPKPLPYLWPDQRFEILFMTWTLHQNHVLDLRYNWISSSDQCLITVNIIYEGLLLIDGKVASRFQNIPISRLEYKSHTLFMTKMARFSWIWYPIYDQNGWKPYPTEPQIPT